MHLQRVQSADLQLHVIVQELLHHRFESKQQLLLLVQLFLRRRGQLLFGFVQVQLVENVL